MFKELNCREKRFHSKAGGLFFSLFLTQIARKIHSILAIFSTGLFLTKTVGNQKAIQKG
jgi:hypothetical protein